MSVWNSPLANTLNYPVTNVKMKNRKNDVFVEWVVELNFLPGVVEPLGL